MSFNCIILAGLLAWIIYVTFEEQGQCLLTPDLTQLLWFQYSRGLHTFFFPTSFCNLNFECLNDKAIVVLCW